MSCKQGRYGDTPGGRVGRRSKDTDSATGSQSASQSVTARRVKLHAANLKANATNADLVVVTVAPAAYCTYCRMAPVH